MASALNAQFYFEDTPCQYNYHTLSLSEEVGVWQAQQSMRQQREELQTLVCEYYELLLDEFGRRVTDDAHPALTLNNLLDVCQAWTDENLSPAASIADPQHFSFWCQFHATIYQYCQLQKRLLAFPASVEHWQHDRHHPS